MAYRETEQQTVLVEQIASRPGVVMLLGASDRGKTTLCARLANAGLRAGRRVAVVDADLGQSEIGPPTTIGFGVVESPIHALREIKPAGLFFVGVTSPAWNLSGAVEGTRRMVQAARKAGATLILVDTSGMVAGKLACVLKSRKIAAVMPDRIIALQSHGELEHILREIDDPSVQIDRLPIPEGVRPKSPDQRTTHRRRRFAEYFRDAALQRIDLSRVHLKGKNNQPNQLVGLQAANGETLGIGILDTFDPTVPEAQIITPVDAADISALEPASLLLTPTGVELGKA